MKGGDAMQCTCQFGVGMMRIDNTICPVHGGQ
jgi:hypothetical protein